MSNAPWFKFFPADYLSSPFVQALEPEQELWYLRLIIASALSEPRGTLPLATGKLWRIAKAPSKQDFELHAAAILAKFERDDAAGVYRVSKIACQPLSSPGELALRRSEAGKRGAEKRWKSGKNNGNLPSAQIATAKRPKADSDPDSDPDSDSDLTSRVPPYPPKGGLETYWQTVKEKLKTDLSTSYVQSKNFQECAYDKYFRDAVVGKVDGTSVFLSSPDPYALDEGLKKLGPRVTAIYKLESGQDIRLFVLAGSLTRLSS